MPALHHFDEALAEDGGLEDAAVEKDGVGGRGRSIRGLTPPARRMAVQERGEVASDTRIADVRQTHFVQAGARAVL